MRASAHQAGGSGAPGVKAIRCFPGVGGSCSITLRLTCDHGFLGNVEHSQILGLNHRTVVDRAQFGEDMGMTSGESIGVCQSPAMRGFTSPNTLPAAFGDGVRGIQRHRSPLDGET